MREPLLLKFYRNLPERHSTETASDWAQRFQAGLNRFKRAVRIRYTEGTLEKLLDSADAEVRQAAVLAVGLMGTMRLNRAVAHRLHDEDSVVRRLAGEALWSLWFRGDTPEHNRELQRLMRLRLEDAGADAILERYQRLLAQAPHFAEAFNQRAILYFRMNDVDRAVADCVMVLRLNPCHYGAASGLAQCYMKQRKFRAALRAYRRAYRLNPNLEGVQQAIESLERMLDEGRK